MRNLLGLVVWNQSDLGHGAGFVNQYLIQCLSTDLREVVPLTEETYVPRAMTALYDAVGLTIDKLGEALDRMPEPERPARVLFVILTDGLENASQRYSLGQIKEMITHRQGDQSYYQNLAGAGQWVVALLALTLLNAKKQRIYLGYSEHLFQQCRLIPTTSLTH